MIDASQIKEQINVKGSDGKHIGTVDRVEGNRVRLASGGMYLHRPCGGRYDQGWRGLPEQECRGDDAGLALDRRTRGSCIDVRAQRDVLLVGLGNCSTSATAVFGSGQVCCMPDLTPC
jgi:hypothetical protein